MRRTRRKSHLVSIDWTPPWSRARPGGGRGGDRQRTGRARGICRRLRPGRRLYLARHEVRQVAQESRRNLRRVSRGWDVIALAEQVEDGESAGRGDGRALQRWPD